MRRSIKILAALLVAAVMVSCGKIDLQEGGEASGGGGKPGDGQGPAAGLDSCLRVSQLAGVPDQMEVAVGGYIVGFVPRTSIAKTVFGVEEAVQTNIVLADSPDETDYHKCAAAQLKANSEEREVLNLFDNPDLLGTYVRLYGLKAQYYYAPGLKPVMDYEFADADDDEEEGRPGDGPKAFPQLSKEAPQVIVGN